MRYNAEQMELISQIRELRRKITFLNGGELYRLNKLVDLADAQNLCWW